MDLTSPTLKTRHPGSLTTAVWIAAIALTAAAHAEPSLHDPRAEGPQAVVVYNSRSPESRDLANHYAAQRGVPANQVFGFDLPTEETISRRDFNERLRKPLLHALEAGNLLSIQRDTPPTRRSGRSEEPNQKVVHATIRYLTLCYGVPLRILPEPGLTDAAQSKLPEALRRNEAAVDSELAWLPASLQQFPVTGPIPNPVYGQSDPAFLHPTNGVLLVGRLDGPTVQIARGLVDKAMAAETNGLWGRAYFDLRGATNQNLQLGERGLTIAAEITRLAGYNTEVDQQPATFPAELPMSHIAFYAGWYDAQASGPFTRSQVEFMPGAIAYHIHSFSAVSIRSPDRYWVGPLLAKGATATVGNVAEPYLELTLDLSVFWPALVGRAFSFGEAALAAQPVLSWQVTVVGDPLYRPFGRLEPGGHIGARFGALHQVLTEQESPLLPWSVLQMANFQLAVGEPPTMVLDALVADPLTAQSSMLQEKVGDLFAAVGKLPGAIRAYERTLALETSPQQRTRVTLALADLLGLFTREREAFDLYQGLLDDVTDYPAPLSIYQKMLPLARRLNDPAKVQRVEAAINRLTPAPSPPAP
jgi:uncharacterized protein (TIGR03790 family)